MYHFIVNPNSRSGQGRAVWNQVEAELSKQEVEYLVHFTARRRHATELAAEITADGEEHTLVVLGGDGSVNEVLNGIHDLEKTILGYIPTGSGNDFGRGLGITNDISASLKTVLHSGHQRKLDVGVISYRDKKRRFAVSSGIGYDAAICHTVCISKVKVFLNKLKLGKLAYVGVSVDRLFHCRPGKMQIVLDDGKQLSFEKAYFAAAMNLPYEGGGCKFCPDALPDDGLLDLIVIADIPKYRALAILPTVFSGKHTHMKGVHIFRSQKAEITSEKPLAIHTDGEPVFLQRHVGMQLERASLRVIVP